MQHSTGEEEMTNDKYYPVEKFVKTRVRSGIKEFLVRREGNYADSWEPEQTISDHLKNEFYTIKTNQKRKGKKKS
jgi:hypothetical protein